MRYSPHLNIRIFKGLLFNHNSLHNHSCHIKFSKNSQSISTFLRKLKIDFGQLILFLVQFSKSPMTFVTHWCRHSAARFPLLSSRDNKMQLCHFMQSLRLAQTRRGIFLLTPSGKNDWGVIKVDLECNLFSKENGR